MARNPRLRYWLSRSVHASGPFSATAASAGILLLSYSSSAYAEVSLDAARSMLQEQVVAQRQIQIEFAVWSGSAARACVYRRDGESSYFASIDIGPNVLGMPKEYAWDGSKLTERNDRAALLISADATRPRASVTLPQQALAGPLLQALGVQNERKWKVAASGSVVRDGVEYLRVRVEVVDGDGTYTYYLDPSSAYWPVYADYEIANQPNARIDEIEYVLVERPDGNVFVPRTFTVSWLRANWTQKYVVDSTRIAIGVEIPRSAFELAPQPNEKVWNESINTLEEPEDPAWRRPPNQRHFPWTLWERTIQKRESPQFTDVTEVVRNEIGDLWRPGQASVVAGSLQRSRTVREQLGDSRTPSSAPARVEEVSTTQGVPRARADIGSSDAEVVGSRAGSNWVAVAAASLVAAGLAVVVLVHRWRTRLSSP